MIVSHHDFSIHLADFFTLARLASVVLVAVAMMVSWHLTLGSRPGSGALVALPVVAGVLAAGTSWFDPMRAEVLDRVNKLVSR